MGSEEMNKSVFLLGGCFAAIMMVALPQAAQAQRAWAQHHLGMPDYQATAPSGQDTVLVHTTSKGYHTVCQTIHDQDRAVIHYDDNETTIGPGQCVEVQAAYITAKPLTDGQQVGVFGYHHVFKDNSPPN